MSNMTVVCICPFCGKRTYITVSEKQYYAYMSDSYTPIQDIFPDLTIQQREALISGMCYNCQEEFFSVEDDEDSEEICDGLCDLCPEGDTCPNSALLEGEN